MSSLKTSIKVDLKGNLAGKTKSYTRSMEQFTRRSEQHITRLGRTTQRVSKTLDNFGKRYAAVLAGGAVAFKTKQAVSEAAIFEKQLVQITQTAGMSRDAADDLKAALFDMAAKTGQPLNKLTQGFNTLVQSGQSWQDSMASIQAINDAMAVTGSNADSLGSALGVAKENFNFDLSDLSTVKLLLDQMTLAGRAGNAEIEDLSGIFSSVGNNAKKANLSFTETLALIEAFSKSEKNTGKLSTLTESTLRLFSNQKQMQKASKATGVSFYNPEGDRRAAFDVLEDIGKKYKTFTTDRARDGFLAKAFEDADLDTVKGLNKIFEGESLVGMRKMAKELEKAGGTIAKDLPEAINNSVDQASRLRVTLRKAADDFSKPINESITKGIKYLLDEQKLSGKELLAGGAATVVGGFAAAKLGSAVLSKVGGLAGGLATGKALEETAGVSPVFVVNMPKDGVGVGSQFGKKARKTRGLGSKILGAGKRFGKTALSLGGAALASPAGGFAAAGLGGAAIGTALHNSSTVEQTDKWAVPIAKVLAALGNEAAQHALNVNEKAKEQEFKHKLDINVTSNGVSVTQSSAAKNTELSVQQSLAAGAHNFGPT